MAIGTLAAARSAQISCPDTLSVVGFDDIQMARYVDPPLTTVRQPMADIGRKTVEFLLDILHGRKAGPVSAPVPHRLILRQSVGLGARTSGGSGKGGSYRVICGGRRSTN